MKTDNIQIELHLLQNFAPSCLNRDDTNIPKDCEFGGFRRARISSQCFKRSIREYFRETGSVSVGERTKRLKWEVIKRLSEAKTAAGDAEEAKQQLSQFAAKHNVDTASVSEAITIFLEAYYSKKDSKRPEETAVLLYISDAESAEIVKIITENIADLCSFVEQRQKAIEKQKTDSKVKIPELTVTPTIEKRLQQSKLSADIALFGRMLAENPDRNADAACQVAHAISTHAVDLEMDFYTAVDDLNRKSDTGAGMLGVTGYNSACFYRYALIDRDQLLENLGGDRATTDEVIKAFLQAAIFAIPTGKQNSMAAQNRPDFGMVLVRQGGVPLSLANAFARPVRVISKQDEDLLGLSVEKLDGYFGKLTKVYGTDGVKEISLFTMTDDDRLGNLKEKDAGSVASVIERTMAAIASAGATQ